MIAVEIWIQWFNIKNMIEVHSTSLWGLLHNVGSCPRTRCIQPVLIRLPDFSRWDKSLNNWQRSHLAALKHKTDRKHSSQRWNNPKALSHPNCSYKHACPLLADRLITQQGVTATQTSVVTKKPQWWREKERGGLGVDGVGGGRHDTAVAVINGKSALCNCGLSTARWRQREGNSARGSCAKPRYRTRGKWRKRWSWFICSSSP